MAVAARKRLALGLKLPDRPGVVRPTALLAAARAAGVLLGTSIRDGDQVWQASRRDFLRNNVDEYVSGIAFLPDHLVPNYSGAAITTKAVEFMQRAALDGKRVHIHCPVYAVRIGEKIVGAEAALNAGTLDTAKALIRKLLDAAAVAVPSTFTGTMDIVNEDVDGEGTGRRALAISAKFPTLVDFWAFCFSEARARWPSAKLFICMNNTEEVGNSAFHQMMRYNFLGEVKKAVLAGVAFDGVTLQGHCIFERGLTDVRFPDFLKEIRGLGLLLRLGEIDARSSSNPGQHVSEYSAAAYDQKVADHHAALLKAALPYVTSGVSLWTLSDADNSWKRNTENTANSNERPCVFDGAFQPKPVVMAAVVKALLARNPVTNFALAPYRNLAANGRMAANLDNFGVVLPTGEWDATNGAKMTSTGTSARIVQAWPVEPGWTVSLKLDRPLGTTSTHIRLSRTLSTADTIGAADTTFSATFPETTYVVPAGCYVLALLAQTGNPTAGRTSFIKNIEFARKP